MKRSAWKRPALALVFLALSVAAVSGGPQQLGIPGGKVLLENDRVVVVEATLAPGATSRMHKHALPAAIVCLEGATIKETLPDGRTRTYERRSGEVAWRDAGIQHDEANVGQTRLRVIAVQIKP